MTKNDVNEQPPIVKEDPLVICFSLLASLHERQIGAAALAHGFACDEHGRVNRGEIAEIGRRHGFMATWFSSKPSQVQTVALPAIINLKDGRAFVLLSKNGKEARLLMPETGMGECHMTFSELDNLADEEILLVKPLIQGNARTLVPMGPSPLNWFWGTLWRFKGFYFESMLATVVANLLTLASVFFSMNVYDRVIPTEAYHTLWTLAIGTSAAILMEFFLRWMKARLIDIAGKRADLAISSTLFREMMTISLEHRPASVGSFTNAMRDFDQLRDFISSSTMVTLTDLPFAFLFIFIIFLISGPLAFVTAAAVPVIILLGVIAQIPLSRYMSENMKESAERQSVLVESLVNLETVKANNAEHFLQGRWDEAHALGTETYQKIRNLTNLMTGGMASVGQMVNVAMIVWGVYLIHANTMTQGALIASVILAGRVIGPLGSVMGLAVRYQHAKMSLKTLDGLVKRPRDRTAGRNYLSPNSVIGQLRAEKLQFAYPGELKIPVVNTLSLSLQAGQKLALLGRVGSGKSTLQRLIAGFYAPESGAVYLDDIDIKQIDPAVLRRHIGYLGQETQLFFGSLRENLVLGDAWISDQHILKVLQTLDLHHLVNQHPRGLDMMLTESGGGLSGGQRQLIAIARLMLRSPRVVLLDEPTSAMDPNTEARVIQVLGHWLKDKTLVLVTHRTQLLEWVDQIGVVDRGGIVALGDKAQMLAKLSSGISVTNQEGAQ
ncbi:MAG: Toxin translocation ATP-binding protein [Pseudomonadota bacterium]